MLNAYVKTQIIKNDLISKVKSFGKDEEGASLVEYSILIGLISAAVIAAVVLVGTKVTNSWGGISTNDQWGT